MPSHLHLNPKQQAPGARLLYARAASEWAKHPSHLRPFLKTRRTGLTPSPKPPRPIDPPPTTDTMFLQRSAVAAARRAAVSAPALRRTIATTAVRRKCYCCRKNKPARAKRAGRGGSFKMSQLRRAPELPHARPIEPCDIPMDGLTILDAQATPFPTSPRSRL